MASNQLTAVSTGLAKYETEMNTKLIQLGQNTSMSYADKLLNLENEIKQSKKMTAFSYTLPCFKSDGVYQLHRSIETVIGVAEFKDDKSPSGNDTMQTLDIKLADGTRKKVPYGDIALPGMGEGAMISIQYDEAKSNLHIKGKCQYKFASTIDEIVAQTAIFISYESIYKNQAIEITNLHTPNILDLSNIDKELMVLSEETKYALTPLYSRLLQPEECIKKGIPLKYGCLLEGPYGTGKTLLAFKLAKQAIQNGWIFIYLKKPELLANTLKLVQNMDNSGHGILIFVEDIDQVTKGDRDTALQDILNTIDGGDTKGANIISLFTTNHIESIEPTFLRGKRIGSVISMGGLDEVSSDEFLKQSFAGSGYTLESDLSPVNKLMAEHSIVPAFAAEIVDSVKAQMVMQEETLVKNEYLIWSINSYLRQVALSHKKDLSETPEKRFVNALREVLSVDKIEESSLITMLEHARYTDYSNESRSKVLEASKNVINKKVTVEDGYKTINEN